MTNTIPNVPRDDLDLIRAALEGFKPCIARDDALRTVRALLSATSPAGVDGLEVYITDCATCVDVVPAKTVTDAKVVLAKDAQAIIDGLRGDVADLHTTMMAAAVEIQEHWAAHCDEEGYGPANLMHRLERGIASQYGYSAETLVRLESQRDQQAQRIGELEELLRCSRKHVAYAADHCEQASMELDRIDAALSAGKEGE